MNQLSHDYDAWHRYATSKTVIICIPVYNGADYLAECLESLTAQKFTDFSVLIIDNASTDNTQEICKNFEDSRFFYSRNSKNVGALGNHNICLDHAVAKYLKILSADDFLLPDTLAIQVSKAEADDTISLVTCNLIETDENLEPRRLIKFFPGKATGTEVIRYCSSRAQNYIGGPSNALIRTSHIKTNRFEVEKKWLADLDFHSKIIKSHKYCNIDEAGFLYRRHSAADSFLSCPPSLRLKNEFWYIKKYRGTPLAYLRVMIRYAKNIIQMKPKKRMRS